MSEKYIDLKGVTVRVYDNEKQEAPTLVFLHGFTGTLYSWKSVWQKLQSTYRIIALDLVGHGETTAPENVELYTMEHQIALLEELFGYLKLQQIILVGYSMGGRIALSYALAYEERLQALVLESASPGLKTLEERQMRRGADAKLADEIERNGIVAFVNKWENIPLFATQQYLHEEVRNEIRQERLSQQASSLANSLRKIGTGSQPSNWDDLKSLTCPVLLITGELDKKFMTLGQEMENILKKGAHQTIVGTGHAIHVEKPTVFATMIEEYLQTVL